MRRLASALLLTLAFSAIPQTVPPKLDSSFRQMLPKLRTRTPILTYHDVIERRDSQSLWFDCSVSEFKAQLDWLAAHHARFITLDQLYAHLVGGAALPSHAIAITFADNYKGFYLRAFPILKARHIPVAMFVHTSMVGSPVGRPKASWAQLAEMRDSGLVTICSQTVTHPADLRKLTPAQLDKEMTDSKRLLRERLGIPVRYIAYPNGKWDEKAVEAARRAGYLMGFTEELRPAETASSILAVPRYVHTKYRQAWADAYGKR
ncbi:MAG TPA: polysaccharide deacetylase family protein [Fimbriimonadaceae bacterium]|nr:polysaccharide deacetylase family protein [Fimbriimonadaceae bacterium]